MPTRLFALASAGVLAAAGTVAIATPAEAAGCQAIVPQRDFYAAGRVASKPLTVPANAGCTTISVKNIQDSQDQADGCQTFLLGFIRSGGQIDYTTPVAACSPIPDGPAVVLASNVPDGTNYRVLYEIDYLGQDIHYGIRH